MSDQWKERKGPLAAVAVAALVVTYLLLEAIGVSWLPTVRTSRGDASAGVAIPAATPLAATVLPTDEMLPQIVPTPVTSTEAPTAVPDGPSASEQATAVASRPFHIALYERFSDPQPNWPNNRLSTAWVSNNEYHLWARQPTQFVAVGAPIEEPFGDVTVSATFRKVGGPPGGGYGLIVRDMGPGRRDGIDQGGRYYVLEMSDNGQVGIWRREGDNWTDLVTWQPSGAVLQGYGTNELAVEAIGDHLTLTVNGIQVAGVVDSVLARGGVGVFVGGDMNEVTLLRFVVSAPD